VDENDGRVVEINRKKDGSPTGNQWNSVASQAETVGTMAENNRKVVYAGRKSANI